MGQRRPFARRVGRGLDGGRSLRGPRQLPGQPPECRAPPLLHERNSPPRVGGPPMDGSAPLVGAGSIALDTLEGGFGRVEDELGGSALYFCLAASLVAPVRMLAVAGEDAAKALGETLKGRPVDVELLSVLDAPSYRWRARQGPEGHNIFVDSDESIYDRWRPRLPEQARWIFIGSMRTTLQLEIARELRRRVDLVAADSMSSYSVLAPREAQDLVGCCDWFFCNEEELAALGGDPDEADGFRRRS